MKIRVGQILFALAALAGVQSAPCVWAGAAEAGTLASQVTDEDGAPVADAIVTAMPIDRALLNQAPASLWAPLQQGEIDQRDETFIPRIQIVARGGTVVFHNNDVPQHSVYSYSPVKAFEFTLKPGDSSDPVVFDKPGVAAVGCYIHDRMIAYVYVTETPWIGRTDQDGHVELASLPPGDYFVKVWHSALRPGKPLATQKVTIGDQVPTHFTSILALLPSATAKERPHGLY
jgi:plastocyanin